MTDTTRTLTREDAIALGRLERSRAFHAGLRALTTWISGGKPQVHATARTRTA